MKLHLRAVLTADGHEPFEHRMSVEGERPPGPTAEQLKSVAQFTCQVWMIGRPDRGYAPNITITFPDEPCTLCGNVHSGSCS